MKFLRLHHLRSEYFTEEILKVKELNLLSHQHLIIL
jgi:hypothetical protein